MRFNLLALIVLLGLLWYLFRWQKRSRELTPALPFSQDFDSNRAVSLKVRAFRLSRWLFWAALLFLTAAVVNVRILEKNAGPSFGKSALPREGIAIYFLLDESGSMIEKVTTTTPKGMPIEIRKVDLAKQVIMEFIDGKKGLDLPGRRDDLVGLIGFARVAQVLCPLTLNHQQIADALKPIEPFQDDRRNGTAIGYAIFKAVNIIVATKYFAQREEEEHKSVYEIKNQAIIIITDGLQSPNPGDLDNPFRFMPPEEAINYAVQNGVRVFYVGIDPTLAQSDYRADIVKMQNALRGSGGDLFIAEPTTPVEEILAKIDKMEKSTLSPETLLANQVHEVPLASLFVLLALISLTGAILLETTVARSAP